VNGFTTITSGKSYLRCVTGPKEASMKRFHLKTIAICITIIAGAFGLAMHAHGENAKPDYVAPLDMTSTYPDSDVTVTGGHAMATRNTSGMGTSGHAPRHDAVSPVSSANASEALPADFDTLGP
jgi:hypothetical protein